MRRVLALPLALALALPLAAQAAGKPRGCLTEPEIRAEQEIRHGIFLREGASRCEGEFVTGVRKAWDGFYTQAADKFGKAKDRRSKALQREFPDNWQRAMTTADGRLVTYHRYHPLSKAYCEDVGDLVQEAAKKGYGAFSKQAKVIQNEVISDYKVCR